MKNYSIQYFKERFFFIFWWFAFCYYLIRSDVHTNFVTQNVNLAFWVGWWVSKNIFIMIFIHRKSHFKRKNIVNKYKKLQRRHVCFPFHHGSYLGTCTRRVFKFCVCNQSAEKGSHFTLLRKKERNYVIRVYTFRNHILTWYLRCFHVY